MFYGEHLSAEEIVVQCKCGIAATIEIFDSSKISCGWFCRDCAYTKRRELRRIEKIAKAIVTKGKP
jgi:hypothetical protein